uniref:VirB4 family type IV secretion/conjugal transfer ATPase n=1 Tax=Marinobacterium profundum TaxID=1714300 RepID=UPI00082D7398|nr:VirB4 family type IV secretion/conjugal transfer ATPase [Marinobacterium profundum]
MTAEKRKVQEVPWHRENSVAEFIPYQAQINENTVKTQGGDLLQVIKLEGIAHESADPEDVEIWKEQLNLLLRNISSPQVALWTNTVRRESTVYPRGEFSGDFDKGLNDKYSAFITRDKMMVNELYLTIIYRPSANKALGFFSSLEKNKEVLNYQQAEAIEKLDEIVSNAVSSLSRYHPRILSTYMRHNRLHSEILEFLDFLVNGDWMPRALPRKPLADCMARVRPFFGADAFELRGVVDSKMGAILGISEYPEGTEPGLLNALLSAPFPLVITQSFNFLSKPVAIELLSRQKKRLETTGDLAVSQIQAIDDGLDDLASSRIVYGEHHLSLTVFGNEPRSLRANLSAASTELADCSMVVAREDWALAAAYWAQLPGNAKYRPRPAPISSRNFAGFSSFHNYPTGERSGNQWGPAVTMFKTSSGAPFYFNFHEPLDNAKAKKKAELMREKGMEAVQEMDDKEEQKALGNTLIIGPSGSGKTVVQGFLMSQSKKFNPTQVIFDKDRGLEIYVRASGGGYLPLKNGVTTGFNPFQMEPTEANLLFLSDLVKKVCGGEFNNQEEKEIDKAVRGVMGLPKDKRRIGRCMDFLDPVEPNGPHARLAKWCEGGSLAWVLDNQEDTLDFDNGTMFGFDVTDFLDNPEVRTPIVMYLFHRIEHLIDGRPFQMFMDEFWKLLMDEYFQDFAENKQFVMRKQNGIMIYGTQSPKSILNSPISHALIGQCATYILMPNPKARREEYVDGLHLSEREFQLVKEEMAPGSRRFLVKKGQNSIVAELNLRGFDDELAVISGTTENVNLVTKIIEQHGDDPAVWLPIFHEQRRFAS